MVANLCEIFLGYSWYIALTHFALAIALFFIVNWIGARAISVGYIQMNIVIQEDTAPAFNFVFKILAPIVFIVLSAVFFEEIGQIRFNKNLYFITIYYWLFRTLWVICTSRGKLINWAEQLIYWTVSIGLSLWIYSLLESVDQILPSPRSLMDQLWILIIIFLYSILNKVQISRDRTIKRKNDYINSRYKVFSQKYDTIIKEYFHNEFYEALTYSIMIYEDFNRPQIVRWIEYVRFWITSKPHTLGIMQVMSEEYIDNEESIRRAMRKIIDDSRGIMESYSGSPSPDANYVAYYIAREYNPGNYKYASEISDIFKQVSTTYYGPMPDSYDEFEIIANYEDRTKK